MSAPKPLVTEEASEVTRTSVVEKELVPATESLEEISQHSTCCISKDEQIENLEKELRESTGIVAALKANLTQFDSSLNCDDNGAGNRSYSLQDAADVMKNIVSDIAFRRAKSMIPQEDIVIPLPVVDTEMQDENASNSTNV